MRERYVDGSALRELRLRRQLRQVDLAAQAAVTTTHLCRIEADTEYCSDLLARRIAHILGCDLDAFTHPGRHPRLDTAPDRDVA